MSDEILSAIAALDTKMTARIDAVQTGITGLGRQLGPIRRDLQDILPRVANLESSVANLESSVANLQDILPRVANLESSVANLEDSMATMRESEISMLGYFNTIQESIATLRAMLTQQQEDSIVPLGAAERAERIALSAREEGRLTAEIVSSLVRQLRTLRERVDALSGMGGAPQQDAP